MSAVRITDSLLPFSVEVIKSGKQTSRRWSAAPDNSHLLFRLPSLLNKKHQTKGTPFISLPLQQSLSHLHRAVETKEESVRASNVRVFWSGGVKEQLCGCLRAERRRLSRCDHLKVSSGCCWDFNIPWWETEVQSWKYSCCRLPLFLPPDSTTALCFDWLTAWNSSSWSDCFWPVEQPVRTTASVFDDAFLPNMSK